MKTKLVWDFFFLYTHLNAAQLSLKTEWCLNQEEQLFDVPFKDVSVTYYFKQVLEQANKQNIKRNFTQRFNLVALSTCFKMAREEERLHCACNGCPEA